MKLTCRVVGMSRQNYYQCRVERKRQGVAEAEVLKAVDEQRRTHPRMGCRKLLGGDAAVAPEQRDRAGKGPDVPCAEGE